MNELRKNNEANNHIGISKEIHREKSKQYINGENVYIYSTWTNRFSRIVLRESTIYKFKNLCSFILGFVFFIIFYTKPRNFREFISVIKVVLKNCFKMFVSVMPFSHYMFYSNKKYHYLVILSFVFCVVSTILLTIILIFGLIETKHKLFFSILFLSSFLLLGINLEHKIFFLLMKISFLFKFFSFILLIVFSVIIYTILFFIVGLIWTYFFD